MFPRFLVEPEPGPEILRAQALPIPLEPGEMALLALTALGLTALFGLFRAGLLHSVPSRILQLSLAQKRRARLAPLLERADSLATSASVYFTTCQILFVVFLWVLLGELLGGEGISLASLGLSLIIAVPLLVVAGEFLPTVLRGPRSDRFLARALPAFELFQRPLAALIVGLEATRSLLMRVLRIEQRPASTREIVEGLLEDSEREQDLAEGEREIIENALGFHDVSVAQVMTPRTEVRAVELREGLSSVVRCIAETGHTRIPVYDENLDQIVGVAYSQEILQALFWNEENSRDLRSLLRSVLFVPETKLASELLSEFRRHRQKIAVVLDEYGGCAGLVTLGDVVTELVGEMPGEFGRVTPPPIARLPDGRVEILGTTRVSEVNEELHLRLPEEEDYETIAGFVLAELGRFPIEGERFEHDGAKFQVVEASDRRVLRVHVRPPQPQGVI